MPELRWVGKEKVVNHHLDVPFRTLRNVYTFTAEAHAAASSGEASEAARSVAGSEAGGNKIIDFDGVYTGSQSVHNPGKEGYRYDVTHPVTQKPCVEPLMGYN